MSLHIEQNLPLMATFFHMGDRPAATILHAQFHSFDFCLGFENKILDQNIPPLEGPFIP